MVKHGRGRPKKQDQGRDHISMVTSCGAVPYSDDLLGFFKIYVPEVCSEKMKIPPAFIHKFDGKIPIVVTLIGSNQHSWQVDVKNTNEHCFFEEGWPEFVQENSLEYGDFMTFSYDGTSAFYVEVFGINGCPKTDNTIEENEASEPENSNHGQTSQKNIRPQMSSMARTYPSFKVAMTKSYTRRGDMHIPLSFADLYIRKSRCCERTVTLRIKHDSWLVSLVTINSKRASFRRGWPKFMKDNALKNGNELTFELVDDNALVFEVDIRR